MTINSSQSLPDDIHAGACVISCDGSVVLSECEPVWQRAGVSNCWAILLFKAVRPVRENPTIAY